MWCSVFEAQALGLSLFSQAMAAGPCPAQQVGQVLHFPTSQQFAAAFMDARFKILRDSGLRPGHVFGPFDPKKSDHPVVSTVVLKHNDVDER